MHLLEQPGVEVGTEGVWQVEQLCLAPFAAEPPEYILRHGLPRVCILQHPCTDTLSAASSPAASLLQQVRYPLTSLPWEHMALLAHSFH